MKNPKRPMRTRENLKFYAPFYEKTLIGRNLVWIKKIENEWIKQEIKTVHIGYSDYKGI